MKKNNKTLKESNSLIELQETAQNYSSRAFINDQLENYGQAEVDYRKSLEKAPNVLDTYIALGNVLFKAKKYDQSLIICNKALSLDNKCKEALWTRSKIYKEKIDYPNAINDLSKMIIFTPEDIEAYHSRGVYYQEFNQHQSAINDFSKVISMDDKNASAYFLRAKSYEEITEYAKAIADYQTYSKLSDNSDEAKERLKVVKDRLYELNRENNKHSITFIDPAEKTGNIINIVKDAEVVVLKGKIIDESSIQYAKINGTDVEFVKDAENNEFSIRINLAG